MRVVFLRPPGRLKRRLDFSRVRRRRPDSRPITPAATGTSFIWGYVLMDNSLPSQSQRPIENSMAMPDRDTEIIKVQGLPSDIAVSCEPLRRIEFN